MTRAAFVIPGDISLPTGGYAYDRRVLALLGAHEVACTHVALPGSYPAPTAKDLAETERLLADVPLDTVLLIDGLAYGALPGDVVGRIKQKIVALVHHPLCLEAGIAPMRQRILKQTETMALAFAAHTVVTSPMTGRIVTADFGVPVERLTVAEPGTDRVPRATGVMSISNSDTTLQMLAVGSVIPRKGYDVLIEALSGLRNTPGWALTIVGANHYSSLGHELRALIGHHELTDRVVFVGPISEISLSIRFRHSDLFVMSSVYEGYGMVLAEAMAYGLPIVCTTGGAAAETVPDEAGIKVQAGNVIALQKGLQRALTDAPLRQKLSDASWAAGQTLPTWDDCAGTIAAVLKKVAS